MPTSVKVLKNTIRKHRINKAEPEYQELSEIPPAFLDEDARREWERLAPVLIRSKIVATPDAAALAAYCEVFALWVRASRMVRKTGMAITTLQGMPIQSPWVGILNKAARQNSLLTKHVNKWCIASRAWANMAAWAKCKDTGLSLDAFEGMPCVCALDLASKIDISALVSLFWKEGTFYTFGKYYLPRDTVDAPRNKHYQGWEHLELLTVTPGAVTDYEYIKEDFRQARVKFDIQTVPYDPFQATQLSAELTAEDFPMIELRPNVLNFFSEPMKELEKLILAGAIRHNGDQVLT